MVITNGLAIALSIMEYKAHQEKWKDAEDQLIILEKRQRDYKTAMFKVSSELVCGAHRIRQPAPQ